MIDNGHDEGSGDGGDDVVSLGYDDDDDDEDKDPNNEDNDDNDVVMVVVVMLMKRSEHSNLYRSEMVCEVNHFLCR